MNSRTCERLLNNLDCTVNHRAVRFVQLNCDCMCASFVDDDGNCRSQTSLRNGHLKRLKWANEIYLNNVFKASALKWLFVKFYFNIRTTAQCPIVAFSFTATLSSHFYETFVQTEIVANRILPAFLVLLKIWEVCRDIWIDFAQRGTPLWWVLFGNEIQN